MAKTNSVTHSLKQFLQAPALRRVKKHLLVAVSGGADSVALLRAVAGVAADLGWKVDVLHCDHGLRVRSKAEARFVDSLCQNLGLSLFAFVGGLKKGGSLEERARDWRRACYAQAARQSGAGLVLLAHHAQDQAETLLLNLVRGAGLAGAQGMLPLTPLAQGSPLMLGRPFLGLVPSELKKYLKSLKQTWKEDASNRDTRHARNRIRHQVIPPLLAFNPKAVENLAAFAGRAQAGKPAQDLAGLLRLDASARKRAGALLRLGHGQADLGQGWTLQMSAAQVRVSKAALGAQTLVVGMVLKWNDWAILLKPAVADPRKLKDGKTFWFSSELLTQPLQVRAAKAGERLEAFGLQGSKLVRDLLAEAKVPQWQREDWPVLVADGRVIAVLGIRRGQGFEVQAGSKALALSTKKSF